MPEPIDFYFDFSSPYGYLASAKIDALAARHGRQVRWKPFLLGVVMKTTGGLPLAAMPLKGDYLVRDIVRSARLLEVEYRHPGIFPVASVAPARAFYWADAQDAERARNLAAALYRAYFVQDTDISQGENTLTICEACGFEREAAGAGVGSQEVKDRLRAETQVAIDKGVFGSPYIIVDREPFWGSDRLDQVERWLATGGW